MITNYFGNAFINLMTGRVQTASLTSGSSYLALSSTQPTVTGSNVTEPTQHNYARVLLGIHDQAATQVMTAQSNCASSNNGKQISFNKVTGTAGEVNPWGVLTYACIFDAATGGNLLWFDRLIDSEGEPTSITPAVGEVAIVESDNLRLSLNGSSN